HRHAESMDGTIVGRPHEAHSESAASHGTYRPATSVIFRFSSQYCRRLVPGTANEPVVLGSGHCHTPELSPDLHTAEAEDMAVHIAGRVSGSDADPNWLGRSCEHDRHACHVSFCRPFSVAISAFPGHCAFVSRRLRA